LIYESRNKYFTFLSNDTDFLIIGGNQVKDQSKAKHVLIQGLVSLRQRISEVERSESERKRVEEDLHCRFSMVAVLIKNLKASRFRRYLAASAIHAGVTSEMNHVEVTSGHNVLEMVNNVRAICI
jgi:hypothetical protein